MDDKPRLLDHLRPNRTGCNLLPDRMGTGRKSSPPPGGAGLPLDARALLRSSALQYRRTSARASAPLPQGPGTGKYRTSAGLSGQEYTIKACRFVRDERGWTVPAPGSTSRTLGACFGRRRRLRCTSALRNTRGR
jgi:hypothetical protein